MTGRDSHLSANGRGEGLRERDLLCRKLQAAGRDRPLATCSALSLLAVLAYLPMSPYLASDLRDFLVPWVDCIHEHGRSQALRDRLREYSGGYVVLLALEERGAAYLGRPA